MRKHFLILMLMALLPLSGWAQAIDLSTADVAITLNRTQLDYTGLPTGPVVTALSVGGVDKTADLATELEVKYYKKTGPSTYAATTPDKVRNVGDYALTLKGDGDPYTTDESPKVDFTINPGTLHITLTTFTEKVYGEADPTVLEYTWDDVTELVGSDDVNNVVLTFTGLNQRAAGENVGEFAYDMSKITVTTANYTVVATGNPKLKINQAPLTITYAPSLDKFYGQANPALDPAAVVVSGWTGAENDGVDDDAERAALLAGKSFAYTQNEVNANADKDGIFLAGITEGYPLSFTGFELDNYTVAFPADKTMKIKQVVLAATPGVLPANNYFTYTKPDGTFTYNGENQAPVYVIKYKDAQGTEHTLDAAQITLSYTYSATEGGAYAATANTKNAGYYKLQLAAVATGNYSGTLANVANCNFAIGKKDLWVYVKSETKVYDNTAFNLASATFEYNGLADDDAITGVTAAYKTVPADDKVVGSYTVKPVIAVDASIKNNYNPTALETGKYTITARPITATAVDQAITFGDPAPVWANTGSFITLQAQEGDEGLIPGDEGTVRAALMTTLPEGQTNVGVYEGAIVITDAGTATNYSITKVAGKYTITGASYTMIAENKTITYGTTYALTDFVCVTSGDDPVGTVEFELWKDGVKLNELPTNAGTYDIKIVEKASYLPSNYDEPITYVPGTFTIAKKAITITPKTLTLNVGATKVLLNKYGTVSYGEPSGLVGEDEIKYELIFDDGVMSTTIDGDLDGTDLENDYDDGITLTAPATAAGFANANYTITAGYAKLTLIGANALVLDDTDTELYKKIEDANTTVRTVSFSSRVLKAGQWNTLVLPFATTVTELSGKLGYAVVDMLNEDNENPENISLVLAFGAIPANTPFLVQPAADVNLAGISFAGKTIAYSADPKATDKANHSLIGTYMTGKKVSNADKSEYYYNVTKKNFVNGGSKGTAIGIMRAYLKDGNAGTSSAAKYISIQEPDGNNTTTAISEVNVENKLANEGWYTVNGMKLETAPTQKGIFIHNGKKVILK